MIKGLKIYWKIYIIDFLYFVFTLFLLCFNFVIKKSGCVYHELKPPQLPKASFAAIGSCVKLSC